MTTVHRTTGAGRCPAPEFPHPGPLTGALTSAVPGPRWRFVAIKPEEMDLTARCLMEATTAQGLTVLIGRPKWDRADRNPVAGDPTRATDKEARSLGTRDNPFTIAGAWIRDYPLLVFSPCQWDLALEYGSACCQQPCQVIIDESAIDHSPCGPSARQRQEWMGRARRLCPNASVAVYKAFTN